MSTAEIAFWTAASVIFYTFCGYPILIGLAARVLGRPARRGRVENGSLSVIVTAYNEESAIERRVQELLGHLSSSRLQGEIIVVSDGSTDDTAARYRRFDDARLRFIELRTNVGKAAALNIGCSAARGQLLVFADVRQSWSPETLNRLVENFADPTVGGVSGDLVLKTSEGVLAGVGLYWKTEKWLRRQESSVHSTVGVSGSVSAVRRELFKPIPPGTILDDVYWPLQVAMQGYRVIHDERAMAYDRLPDRPRDEFRRKIRTLSGNFQLVAQNSGLLAPWRNPIWFQFVSHKVCRLIVPWAFVVLAFASLIADGMVYRCIFWLLFGSVLLSLAGMRSRVVASWPLISIGSTLLILNSAAWLAFWVWTIGRTSRSWTKVAYSPMPAPADLLKRDRQEIPSR